MDISQLDPSAAEAEFARRQVARSIAVPTDDVKVKQRFRDLGEPIILFGEGPADRRDRLRHLLSLGTVYGQPATTSEAADEGQQEEEYYTPGPEALLHARRALTKDSLIRARERIALAREDNAIPLAKRITHRKQQNARLRTFVSQGSQIAADRPVAMSRFSPNSQSIATCSWAGDLRIFDAETLDQRRKVTGHSDRVSGLAWHPRATLDQDSSAVHLVTGGGEGDVCLWDAQSDTPIARLKGHGARVARVAFHPSGKYVASASFDGTWRLWDVAMSAELLLQQGHSHEVYTVAFQDDGSLVASAGLDAIGRVWDLRSGKTIMMLQGHMRTIQGLDWSPNAYQIATGSADDTIKIWDLRKVSSIATIPAHKSLVSDVRYFRAANNNDVTMSMDMQVDGAARQVNASGTFLASSGYDGAVNIWNADDWTLIKSLTGAAEKKIMSVDISGDGRAICSSAYDRTLSLWASDQQS